MGELDVWTYRSKTSLDPKNIDVVGGVERYSDAFNYSRREIDSGLHISLIFFIVSEKVKRASSLPASFHP